METILVTDTHKPLGFQLLKSFLAAGLNAVAAPTDKPEDDSRKGSYDGLGKKRAFAVVPWNRSSPLSAKNLLLQSRQLFPSLDAALILLPPLPPAVPFADLKYLDVETVLDVWLKGSILLARDLYAHFVSQKRGSLSFVNLSVPKSGGASLLDDLCREGMLVTAQSLMKAGKEDGVNINAFLSRSVDAKAYAEFVAKTTLEKCNKAGGKLFYFQW